MNVKFIELRDSATFIPVIAIEVQGFDHYLMRRAGWGRWQRGVYIFNAEPEGRYTFAMGLIGAPVLHTSNIRAGDRTYRVGFTELAQHWDDYASGDVLDVEYVLGETDTPKESEQHARD